MIKKGLLYGLMLMQASCFGSRVWLSLIENNTAKTLYEVHIPHEKYSFLLPPNTKKSLGTWVNFKKRPDIFLGVLKGDGDPIFLDWGPESSAECSGKVMVQSFIYWAGEQNPPSTFKTYMTCCLNEEIVELGLRIHPNGKPEMFVIKGAMVASVV